MSDEFDELFVKEVEFNKKELVETLKPFIQLSEKGEFLPSGAFAKLKANAQILIYCATRKILKTRELIQDEGATPGEISKMTGLPDGTVKPAVRKLADERLLRGENGKYVLPNHAVSRVKSVIDKKESGQ